MVQASYHNVMLEMYCQYKVWIQGVTPLTMLSHKLLTPAAHTQE